MVSRIFNASHLDNASLRFYPDRPDSAFFTTGAPPDGPSDTPSADEIHSLNFDIHPSRNRSVPTDPSPPRQVGTHEFRRTPGDLRRVSGAPADYATSREGHGFDLTRRMMIAKSATTHAAATAMVSAPSPSSSDCWGGMTTGSSALLSGMKTELFFSTVS